MPSISVRPITTTITNIRANTPGTIATTNRTIAMTTRMATPRILLRHRPTARSGEHALVRGHALPIRQHGDSSQFSLAERARYRREYGALPDLCAAGGNAVCGIPDQ